MCLVPGSRVGVILEETPTVVRFLGFGKYVRDEPPGRGSVPAFWRPERLREVVRRIEIDGGLVVWDWEATAVKSERDMRLALREVKRAGYKEIVEATEDDLRRIRRARARRFERLRAAGVLGWPGAR